MRPVTCYNDQASVSLLGAEGKRKQLRIPTPITSSGITKMNILTVEELKVLTAARRNISEMCEHKINLKTGNNNSKSQHGTVIYYYQELF